MMLIVPGPISYSLGSSLADAMPSPPTSSYGFSLGSASVLMNAVKKLSTTAAVSSLSV